MKHGRAFFMIVTWDWRLGIGDLGLATWPAPLVGGCPDYFLNVYLRPKPSAKLVGLSV